jgi:hypothetical protein
MTYINSPRQAHALAALLEQALYPMEWPDGSLRDTDDIREWQTPMAQTHNDNGMLVVQITAGNGQRVALHITEAGRTLAWHEDQQAYEPAKLEWWQDERWPSALWKLHVEFDEPSWYDGRGSMTHCTFPEMVDGLDTGRFRTGVVWTFHDGFIPDDHVIVRDHITGEFHTVRAHSLGIGVGDDPCPMCGTHNSIDIVVEYGIECPAHMSPLDSDEPTRARQLASLPPGIDIEMDTTDGLGGPR